MTQQPQDRPQDHSQPLVKTYTMPINLDMWLKSFESNPDPNALYISQVNSTEELLERCQNMAGRDQNAEEFKQQN